MARRLSRLPVAWSDDVVTDAQPPSCQDKPHQIKPNRTEPNRTEPNRTEPNRTEPNRTEQRVLFTTLGACY
jgi:hypothetical protein